MASSKSCIPIFLLVLISPAYVLASSSPPTPPLGGWQPIKNMNDPDIQELAKFALTEHNKLRGARLQFGRVTGGAQQVVAGDNYKLILPANNGDGKDGKYEAFVWVRSWEKFRKTNTFPQRLITVK